uniref:Cytochrome b n=1 Tax=Harpactocrates apennicola TaxID=1110479 RepID=A0A516IMQ9_9ARAC|nr:cytochrome b [Harpactocrates apennicola]QDP17928.1 cytochrome b [Harpactocrates apennicola]
MKVSVRKSNTVLWLVNNSLIDLPSPSSISYMWSFGSLLGVFLGVQLVTGILLALHYSGDVMISFYSVVHICRDVSNGWLLRVLHSNGASMFFAFLYFHIGRGLYYGSYRYFETWLSGSVIFLLAMGTAFLGYVLPWGQMSFWAATVITNLLSAVPYLGVMLVEWVWGGFAVGNPTLVRFFAFHFLFPFILVMLVCFHLVFLHQTGSNNPLGQNSDMDKVNFYPYFLVSDLVGFLVAFYFLLMVSMEFPYVFMDVENFILANSLVTPIHIQPEWYFLFAYTILRSISSKIGGVVALLMSVLILMVFPFVFKHRIRGSSNYLVGKILFWWIVINWLLLTWIGACVVEYPFMELGKCFSVLYFILFMVWGLSYISVDNFNN